MAPIKFFVLGRPVPQGSVRSFETKGGQHITAVTGNLQRWRGDIRDRATRLDMARLDGPVAMVLAFDFERPPSHFNKAGTTVRAGAPPYPSLDLDKLCRAVLDALTGIAYRDDSQVVTLAATKTYQAPSGVWISIQPEGLA